MSDIKIESDDGIDANRSGSVEYESRPLSNPSNIRIVILHPTRTESGSHGPVSIEFIHTTLEEDPPFVGISYTWGSSTRNRTVLTTNNEVLYVTENVREVLQRLDPKESDQPTHIWTDQLCINQSDEEEKWQQVRIMRRIYQHAKATFVVLCTDGDAIDEILFMIEQIDITPLRSIVGPWSVNHSTLSRASWTVCSDSEFRKLLMRVVKNVVLSRAWVYQEIVSGERAILLGTRFYMDWDIFARVFMQCLFLEAQAPTDRHMDSGSAAS